MHKNTIQNAGNGSKKTLFFKISRRACRQTPPEVPRLWRDSSRFMSAPRKFLGQRLCFFSAGGVNAWAGVLFPNQFCNMLFRYFSILLFVIFVCLFEYRLYLNTNLNWAILRRNYLLGKLPVLEKFNSIFFCVPKLKADWLFQLSSLIWLHFRRECN